ncbi:hypothetical protein LUZ60_002120 [Juncus effusus]|nr:hypothetical protein LUZ60_002120 [Juncus effusus]
MSKDPQTENHDIVGYYKQLISSLLSEKEATFPLSHEEKSQNINNSSKDETFFTDIVGLDISENKKEMLKTALRECVASLNQEADKVLNKLAMLQIESDRREDLIPEASRRKRKAHDGFDFSQCSNGSNEMCSPELLDKICKMKEGADELLNEIANHCRPMSVGEKQRLGSRIKKLPEKSFDRVLEILECTNLSYEPISIDLEKQDDVTLWRLYYYVETVLHASKV